jgi:cytochrome d ubiquinol oxidase subunit I
MKSNQAQRKAGTKDTIPNVAALFFSFRAMVASGALMLLLFLLAAWSVAKRNAETKPWLLKFALFALPLPWIAIQTVGLLSGEFLPQFL